MTSLQLPPDIGEFGGGPEQPALRQLACSGSLGGVEIRCRGLAIGTRQDQGGGVGGDLGALWTPAGRRRLAVRVVERLGTRSVQTAALRAMDCLADKVGGEERDVEYGVAEVRDLPVQNPQISAAGEDVLRREITVDKALRFAQQVVGKFPETIRGSW